MEALIAYGSKKTYSAILDYLISNEADFDFSFFIGNGKLICCSAVALHCCARYLYCN